MFALGEQKVQEMIARGPAVKSRIPQKLTAVKPKPYVSKSKPASNPDSMYRPMSACRGKDESPVSMRGSHAPVSRLARPEREKLLPAQKRASTIPKQLNEAILSSNKGGRSVITVPLTQRQVRMPQMRTSDLPTQDKIMKSEELEIHKLDQPDVNHALSDINVTESITSRSHKALQLKACWQEMLIQYEKMNNDLKHGQNAIVEHYADMQRAHQKMIALGETANLPSPDDLRIMNVAKMTPEQLLQLCAAGDPRKYDDKDTRHKTPLTLDIDKLLSIPTKIVSTCQQTIEKRKEVIDWFDSLKSIQKGISMNKLSKQIQEFNAENDMLQCSLDRVKTDFIKEIDDVVDYLRKGVNETMILQLHTEELTYKLSELNSQNADLKKQIFNANLMKSHMNKSRIEELEKELKEEKCKKVVIRDRLSRAEGQSKVNTERIAQLEASLEKAQSQSWTLERTVQELREQNQKLQSDFDKELSKLTGSIKENTAHLEEIAVAREKLQTEKEYLEKRLTELSDHYNESLKNVKHEMNVNVAKLIETENKHSNNLELIKTLEVKVKSLSTQLQESEMRCKQLTKQLQDKECQLSKITDCQKELEAVKKELESLKSENEDYRNHFTKQTEAVKEIQRKFEETMILEERLKYDLANKEEYIAGLEKQRSLLEQQLQESESKMMSYEKQLSSLKNHIEQLQKDFGEFENLEGLREMINEQRSKLLEVTRRNKEMAEALQKKEIELEEYVQNLSEQAQILEQRESILKMLTEKEEESTNIIKLLRENIEMRSQADAELSQQVEEKDAEIRSLVANVETRKQQISQLEKIILTLEEQVRRVTLQKRKDQDKINLLENKMAEMEAYYLEKKHSDEKHPENLDNIIKILEEELASSIEPQFNPNKNHQVSKKNLYGNKNIDIANKLGYPDRNDGSLVIRAEHESVPTKMGVGNYVRQACTAATDAQFKVDNLDRKKASTKLETQRWISAAEPGINFYATPTSTAKSFPGLRDQIPVPLPDDIIKRNLQLLHSQKLNDKKCKMFKIAGHKLS